MDHGVDWRLLVVSVSALVSLGCVHDLGCWPPLGKVHSRKINCTHEHVIAGMRHLPRLHAIIWQGPNSPSSPEFLYLSTPFSASKLLIHVVNWGPALTESRKEAIKMQKNALFTGRRRCRILNRGISRQVADSGSSSAREECGILLSILFFSRWSNAFCRLAFFFVFVSSPGHGLGSVLSKGHR
jgi:hypothetical protein